MKVIVRAIRQLTEDGADVTGMHEVVLRRKGSGEEREFTLQLPSEETAHLYVGGDVYELTISFDNSITEVR